MVEVDLALVLGAAGTLLGLGSLTYARVQAVAQKQQAQEQQRISVVEINRAMDAQVRALRELLVTNPSLMREYLEANPSLAGVFEPLGGLGQVVTVRNILDSVHDAWHLREQGIVSDHYWRNWEAAIPPISRMRSIDALFENAASRGAYDGGFVAAWRAMRDEGRPLDPRAPK